MKFLQISQILTLLAVGAVAAPTPTNDAGADDSHKLERRLKDVILNVKDERVPMMKGDPDVGCEHLNENEIKFSLTPSVDHSSAAEMVKDHRGDFYSDYMHCNAAGHTHGGLNGCEVTRKARQDRENTYRQAYQA
ncbi:hypothetical protein PspLS_07540 [Pyricularia sp. CBS 133598]|nr:hypothetical protein PspLS_07540 [Pyricularia sp. CBS 133598]